MAKQPKKSKTPKVRGGGKTGRSGQDAITGLYWEVDGIGKLQSDKVYSISYEQMQKALTTFWGEGYTDDTRPADEYPVTLEVEIAKNMLVATSKDKHGNTSRSILRGDYEFTQGKLTSARITESVYVDAFVSGGLLETSGMAESYPGGRRIEKVNDYFSFYVAMNPGGNIISEYYSSETDISGNPSYFLQYGEGRFFYNGWQNNPFDSNLI
jgi:hypothetical protein